MDFGLVEFSLAHTLNDFQSRLGVVQKTMWARRPRSLTHELHHYHSEFELRALYR